jgi:preprotein translocase subunit SecA
VKKIRGFVHSYAELSDEELRAKTAEFQGRYGGGESLDQILPEAFAAVVSVCQRLCGKTFSFCGHTQCWEMIPYDEQLYGAIAMHRSKIAEMATGEGKTLVASLPLYLNALTGKNCQLVTVNDYLARRDAEWMGNIYRFLGLTVGCIQNSMDQGDRKRAYGCNITYGTAAEFGFDYLRDNGLTFSAEEQVQRDHYFCIVDEIDSILIDEARTPLVISGHSEEERMVPFRELCPLVAKLSALQLQLCNRLVDEARDMLAKNPKHGPAILKLYQVQQGMPKHRQLLKLLESNSLRNALEKLETELGGESRRGEKFQLRETLYFIVDERQNSVDLTELGRKTLYPDHPDAFVLPDLSLIFCELDRDHSMDEEQRQEKKQQTMEQAEILRERIHCISQLLRAHTLFEKDQHYIVHNGQILIVDPHTGRAMEGRRWSDGLHQAVEAKEGLSIRRESHTFATITIQNYFRLYEKLAGMTGTAETEVQEFHDIYNLPVIVIPTHRPCIRKDANDAIYKTRREKYAAVLRDIEESHAKGQPVLVGTTSVEASELIAKMLQHAHLAHTVLNAKFHEMEANIVARAGEIGAITIATNMAGRGTDIRLSEGVAQLGGLKVLGTERHESRRIDRQLRGRCARQGDPGSAKFYISLEDDLMRLFASRGPMAAILERTFHEGDVLSHPLLNRSIAKAQKRVEAQNYALRKRLLEYDDVLNRQREVIYSLRNEVLRSENLRSLLWDFALDFIKSLLQARKDYSDDSKFFSETTKKLNTYFPLLLEEGEWHSLTDEKCVQFFIDRIADAYAVKEEGENAETMRFIERITFLRSIDHRWKQHLSSMDDLRRSVGLHAYAQKNPLYEYKVEAFSQFEQLLKLVRQDVLFSIFRSASSQEALRTMMKRIGNVRGRTDGAGENGRLEQIAPENSSPSDSRTGTCSIGRNGQCPCGSGKKYKKCCGKDQ